MAITCGADGVLAADRESRGVVSAPTLPTDAIDTTGAGDAFPAAFVLGPLSGWPLAERVRFATLCGSLSVRQFGGSLAAPGWHDIATWWRDADPVLRKEYAFVATAPLTGSRPAGAPQRRPRLPSESRSARGDRLAPGVLHRLGRGAGDGMRTVRVPGMAGVVIDPPKV